MIKYYIIKANEDETCGFPNYLWGCFYTNNEHLMMSFMDQYEHISFDVCEAEFATESELHAYVTLKLKWINFCGIDDKLEVFTSENRPDIHFVTSRNYLDTCGEYLDSALTEMGNNLMASLYNVSMMAKYLIHNESLKRFISFIKLYLARYLVVSNSYGDAISDDAVNDLGINESTSILDVVDIDLMEVMMEFGWDGK